MDSSSKFSIQGSNARVVVAVDFGTTFSGFAYAHVDSPDDIHKLYEWEGAMETNAVAYCKTQTSLYYTACPDGGALKLQAWGWPAYASFNEESRRTARAKRTRSKVEDQAIGFYVTRFKLHLAGAANVRTAAGGQSAEPLPPGLTVDTAITDYLTGLSDFILKQLQKTYGPQLTVKEVQWCLTVPAIWDDSAKLKMKIFAERAGMVQGRHTPRGVEASPHRLIICLEPEAASFYCLRICKDIQLKVGDQYLIADIGGGTVDIVVHEKASEDDELKVKEVVASYGGLCGGTYVDNNLFEFLKKKIGCFEEYLADKPALRLELQRTWEFSKRTYTGKPNSWKKGVVPDEAWNDAHAV